MSKQQINASSTRRNIIKSPTNIIGGFQLFKEEEIL